MSEPLIIAIIGATASGKTNLAIRLAQKFQTEIISFDARQCYQEINIGVAKPTPLELETIPHHFINLHSIYNPINAADFAIYAKNKIKELQQTQPNKPIILVGGSGLYLKALLQGFDPIPNSSSSVKNYVANLFQAEHLEGIQNKLLALFPQLKNDLDLNNPHRVQRALEVALETGLPITAFWDKQKKQKSPYYYKIIQINWLREDLYHRIDLRTESMIKAGFEDEARQFIKFKHLTPLQTVGYKEFFDYFDNKMHYKTTIEKIKQHTKNYAKRQLTWFRNQEIFKEKHYLIEGKNLDSQRELDKILL